MNRKRIAIITILLALIVGVAGFLVLKDDDPVTPLEATQNQKTFDAPSAEQAASKDESKSDASPSVKSVPEAIEETPKEETVKEEAPKAAARQIVVRFSIANSGVSELKVGFGFIKQSSREAKRYILAGAFTPDEEGRYEVKMAPGHYDEARIIADGFLPYSAPINLFEKLEHDFGAVTLESSPQFRVRVVDENDQPIAGAKVRYEEAYDRWGLVDRRGVKIFGEWQGHGYRAMARGEEHTCDAQGEVLLRLNTEKAIRISAHTPEFVPQVQVVEKTKEREGITLKLASAGQIEVVVIGVETNAQSRVGILPASQAEYYARYRSASGVDRVAPLMLRGIEEGKAKRADGVAAGEWIAVYVDDKRIEISESFTIWPGKLTQVTIDTPALGEVFGVITGEDGAALADHKVMLVRNAQHGMQGLIAESKTNNAGAYHFKNVPAAELFIVLEADFAKKRHFLGLEDKSMPRRVMVEAGAIVEKNVDLSIRHGATLEGKVLVNGKPFFEYCSINVEYKQADGRVSHTFRNGIKIAEDGSFRILDLPAGSRTLSFGKSGKVDGAGPVSFRTEVLLGGLGTVTELNLNFKAYRLAGTVVSEDKAASFREGRVMAEMVGGAKTKTSAVVSDDGRFIFPLLFEGDYVFTVKLKHRASKSLSYRVERDEENWTIESGGKGGSLRVEIESLYDGDGLGDRPERRSGNVIIYMNKVKINAEGMISKYSADFSKEGDTRTISGIAKGTYQVYVRVTGFAPQWHNLVVDSEGTQELLVNLRRSGVLRASITLPKDYDLSKLDKVKVIRESPSGKKRTTLGSYFGKREDGSFFVSVAVNRQGVYKIRVEGEGLASQSAEVECRIAELREQAFVMKAKE